MSIPITNMYENLIYFSSPTIAVVGGGQAISSFGGLTNDPSLAVYPAGIEPTNPTLQAGA